MEAKLPTEILKKAFRASNGELAWAKPDAVEAATALAAHGMAILGGEVWSIQEGGRWQGLIPQTDGSPDSVYHWELEPQKADSESWQTFCDRATRYAVSALESLNAERDVIPELRHRIRFNLTYVSQQEYQNLKKP